jgi:hypothetical protein
VAAALAGESRSLIRVIVDFACTKWRTRPVAEVVALFIDPTPPEPRPALPTPISRGWAKLVGRAVSEMMGMKVNRTAQPLGPMTISKNEQVIVPLAHCRRPAHIGSVVPYHRSEAGRRSIPGRLIRIVDHWLLRSPVVGPNAMPCIWREFCESRLRALVDRDRPKKVKPAMCILVPAIMRTM